MNTNTKEKVPYNYYKEQIEYLNPSPDYGYAIKIRGIDSGGNDTKWIAVNEESAIELIIFLGRFLKKS
jgi:hypothetical protein